MPHSTLPSYLEFIADGEPIDCAAWRTKIIQRCKWISDQIWKHWYHLYQKEGYVQANLWLVSIKKRLKLGNTGLSIGASSDELKSYAEIKARTFAANNTDFGSRFGKKAAVWAIKEVFEQTGLTFPLAAKHYEKEYNGPKVVAALARIQDPMWLKRQLQTKSFRELEQLNRELGLVRKKTSAYLSNFTFKRVLIRKNSNRKLLEKLKATNDLGQEYSLAELSDLGVSNPVLRRNELMTRLSGFEEYAENDERVWVPMFYTITTPSKFHCMKVVGGNKTILNPNFNGSTPKEAQTYLNTLWQRARAEIQRQDIEHFGFRVAEPHHDGTPHWHILLFVRKEHEKTLTTTLRNYAFAEDGNESGAFKHRFEAVEIDPKKGRATGYIAKYISKNIDGFQVEIDEEAGEYSSIASIRATCWSSVWGIRQFQQIGGPPVTVWRELRRIEANDLKDQCTEKGIASESLESIHEAADSGDWKGFTREMGGATVKRKSLLLRAMYFVKVRANKYAEDIRKLTGLLCNDGQHLQTRFRTWTIGLMEIATNKPSDHISRTGPPVAPLEFCQ